MSTKNKVVSWYKERRDIIIPSLILFTISAAFFGLGYLSANEFNPAPVIIEKCGEDTSQVLSKSL